ncbi:MAG: hypothetical protein ACRENP_05920 [Longimicrobiales bacterium]
MGSGMFPQDRKFALAILDDAALHTIEEARLIYRLLIELGLTATKTVWASACKNGGGLPDTRCTLEDPEYRDFILELRDQGIEIGWAGAARESSARQQTIEALDYFREVVGYDPRVQVNGALNRENLYWGTHRIDQPLLKAVVQRAEPVSVGYYNGHVEDSPFWWGDVCSDHIDYVLNLTFDDVNLARINPSMPYQDPTRPWVRQWFSGSEAQTCIEFNQLLRPDRQEKLEREAGYSVVATSFARGFVRGNVLDRLARKRLESMAARGGWFVTVSTLLDHLRARRSDVCIGADEWNRMQWKWARDVVRKRVRSSGPKDVNWRDAAIG